MEETEQTTEEKPLNTLDEARNLDKTIKEHLEEFKKLVKENQEAAATMTLSGTAGLREPPKEPEPDTDEDIANKFNKGQLDIFAKDE